MADNLGYRTEGTTVTKDLVSFESLVRSFLKIIRLFRVIRGSTLKLVFIRVHSRLEKFECTQIFPRFIEATTSECRHKPPPVF